MLVDSAAESIRQINGVTGNLKSRSDWQIALAITVLLRVIYSAVAIVGALLRHPQAALVRGNALTENIPPPYGWHYLFLQIWERFDTLWYLHIAERGYDRPAAVVFYPLYPLLIRGLSRIVEPIAGALLISSLATFFYFYAFLRLAKDELSEANHRRAVYLAAVWPASFFLFAGYTEGLAMALIVWCIMWARNEHWVAATGCAIAAGLTRSAGTLLIVPLLIMAWRSQGKKSQNQRWCILAAPLGTLSYWFWLRQTGRFSVRAAYRTYWNTEVAAPWITLWRAIQSLVHHFEPLVILSLGALSLFFVAAVLARRRTEDRWFSAAIMVHLLLRMCSPPLFGTPRYLLPVYPAYLTMGDWVKKMNGTRFVFLCAALFACNLGWLWAFLNWSLVL